jgi:hypothetical protein
MLVGCWMNVGGGVEGSSLDLKHDYTNKEGHTVVQFRLGVAVQLMQHLHNLVDEPDRPRVHFSAGKTGLRPRQRVCSGLGLDLGVDQSPSPLISLQARLSAWASPFARLAEKRACTYFLSPSA